VCNIPQMTNWWNEDKPSQILMMWNKSKTHTINPCNVWNNKFIIKFMQLNYNIYLFLVNLFIGWWYHYNK
jgi:hypothetical protein